MLSPDIEGNFRTWILDHRMQPLASGDAMVFPSLGLGAFYPDHLEQLEHVSREGRYFLRGNGIRETIRNLRPQKPVASLPRVYFDWGGD
jgi:hypothetical protein